MMPMIVTVRPGVDAALVRAALVDRGLWVQRLDSTGPAAFAVEPHSARVSADLIRTIDGVADVLASRSEHPLVDAQGPMLEIDGLRIGRGEAPVFMAGPCSVESEAQIESIAARLAPAGAQILRGGAFKPRTSPYAFQGHGEQALEWLCAAAARHRMKTVTEVMSPSDVELVARYADILQVGSRNMHNYSLLRAVGAAGRPVLLKRGMSASIEEWLNAGEYCLLSGAASVIFCERGIRSFDPSTRNVLDLGAVALLAHVHHQVVIVDPSHGTGRRDLIAAMSRASLAAGAAGVMIETHDAPGKALSDGPQALLSDQLASLLGELNPRERRSSHV